MALHMDNLVAGDQLQAGPLRGTRGLSDLQESQREPLARAVLAKHPQGVAKRDCRSHGRRRPRAAAERNNQRLHSLLGNTTPDEYEWAYYASPTGPPPGAAANEKTA